MYIYIYMYIIGPCVLPFFSPSCAGNVTCNDSEKSVCYTRNVHSVRRDIN